MPKHLILGTAGHIDHGKTALIKALTGFDCDTHREEKQRGITIHLGFSHLDLSDDISLGIVDVPGHAAFIKTMVAGACGIDFCMLVIAADSGVMPQTLEHLQIMQVLGIRSGMIALTKTDLVDNDIAEMAGEEIAELVKGTFLQNCPIIPVSSKTGEGIEDLNAVLLKQASEISTRKAGEVFRLYIDRIFSVKGFGTVVTGSVISGVLKAGDTAVLLPGEKVLRVRRLERHGSEVESVSAGDRASINLAGLDNSEYRRGMLISDRPLRTTNMIDARLTLFKESRGFSLWTQVIFYLGTFEAQARVHLIDSDHATGGETVLVQIHLPQQCVAQAGDRFVVRNTSSDITLGGGEIIDPFPLHHRRRPQPLIEQMKQLAGGSLSDLIAAQARKSMLPVDTAGIADMLNISRQEVDAAAKEVDSDDIIVLPDDSVTYLHRKASHEHWKERILAGLKGYHKRNALDEHGRSAGAIAGMLGVSGDSVGESVIGIMLEAMVSDSALKKADNTYALAGHRVALSDDMKRKIGVVDNFLKDSGMKTPLMSELVPAAQKQGIIEEDLKKILKYLAANKTVYFIEDSYVHATIVDPVREKLATALKNNPSGMTVAQFRDLIGGNRKICLLLYALFDKEGTTKRQGDVRVLAKA